LPQTTLKSGEIEGRDVSAAVELTTTGDRVALEGWIGAAGARLPGVSGQGARLNLTGNLPYPDLKTRRGDGRAAIGARLTALRFDAGEASGREADVRLSFDGQT